MEQKRGRLCRAVRMEKLMNKNLQGMSGGMRGCGYERHCCGGYGEGVGSNCEERNEGEMRQ